MDKFVKVATRLGAAMPEALRATEAIQTYDKQMLPICPGSAKMWVTICLPDIYPCGA